MNYFSKTVMEWYRGNKRDLPWRHTKDPYLVWLSEVILQQTRVEQGLPYYLRFAKKFPTVKHLAKADEKEVMKLWQGLGYYSRARNLHAAAKYVAAELGGKFPASYDALIKLKGVGRYTAGAVASIAFSEPKPVVDGNVYRVLARYFAIDTPIDSAKGKKEFYELAYELLDRDDPGTFNQAVMEFGARQCLPKKPGCADCPLNCSCLSYSSSTVQQFPVKSRRAKVRNRYFYYIVARYKGNFFIRHRSGRDIWKGLYDFPLVETKKQVAEEKLLTSAGFRELIGKGSFSVKKISPVFRHVLSHQQIFARFIDIELRKNLQDKSLVAVPGKKLGSYAVPRLIERYLEKNRKRKE